MDMHYKPSCKILICGFGTREEVYEAVKHVYSSQLLIAQTKPVGLYHRSLGHASYVEMRESVDHVHAYTESNIPTWRISVNAKRASWENWRGSQGLQHCTREAKWQNPLRKCVPMWSVRKALIHLKSPLFCHFVGLVQRLLVSALSKMEEWGSCGGNGDGERTVKLGKWGTSETSEHQPPHARVEKSCWW